MKWLPIIVPAALCLLPLTVPAQRVTDNFDAGWSFLKADATGAEQVAFDDTTWRKLDLPHDWSIEGPFAATNLTGGAGGFLPSGVGWYRKHFTLPGGEPNRRIFVEFDGVMQNSDVWINGFHLGHRPYGYVGFSDELTGLVNWGGNNVIAVRTDTSAQPASRWYSGAGIYRHVRLVQTTPVYIPPNEVFISTPEVSLGLATVHAQVTVTNLHSTPVQVFLNITLLAPDGSVAGSGQTRMQSIPATGAAQFERDLVITHPQRWELAHPVLYQAKVTVAGPPPEPDSAQAASDHPQTAGSWYDETKASFGVREFHFDADTGFWLNENNFKLKGVCLHQDAGAFGVAVPMSVWEERLATLKSLGVNAIRTAHNPPAPEFLDLCDRMGFLVMDEMFDCWTVGKNRYDYHLFFNDWSLADERDAILRDRNHPSVILYSVGNEIHDTPNAPLAKRILKGLVEVAHAADPTRPVTQALFRPNVSHDYDNGLADLLDVVGQNYRENEILAAHEQKPARRIVGTENKHDRATWTALRDHPAYAGQFLWTGIDYLGEAKNWPVVGHGSGLLDRTGAIRPLARERQSWWHDQPMVAIARRIAPTDLMPTDPGYGAEERHTQVLFSDWTPKETQPHKETVEVYSNVKEVELFLNGKSLGSKTIASDAWPRTWQVPFAPGELKAVARADGIALATNVLHTAGQPSRIELITEDPVIGTGWDDVALVRARITDKQGVEIPRARDLITFTISGPGAVVAVDNGDNGNPEPFQTNVRHAFQGECVAFVKAAKAGTLRLSASAPGLAGGSLKLKAVKGTILAQ